MSEPSNHRPEDTPLNPALKSTTERAYDTTHTTPPPLDTTSAKEGEGEGWPIIWVVVTVICVALAIWFIL